MDVLMYGIQVFAWRKYVDVVIRLLLCLLLEYQCKAISQR